MTEIVKFRPEEINEAIEGLDGLRDIIAPLLRRINGDGLGEQDAQQFIRQLTLAKHALIAMGDFLEEKMSSAPSNAPLTPEQLLELEGEPVWLGGSGLNRWDIFTGGLKGGFACFLRGALPMETIGRTWTPYRRRPEARPVEREGRE